MRNLSLYSKKILKISAILNIAAWGHLARAESLALDPKASSLTFVGESFLHSFHGEASELSGSADVDATAVPPVQKASLDFKTTKLTTFNAERDKKMKDWLHVDIHPDATFMLERVKPISGDYKTADASHPAAFSVKGTLALNGVKQPLSGTALGWREKNRLVVSGSAVVNTLEFGLPQIRMAVITVGTNIQTSYRFSFILPPDLTLADAKQTSIK